ncbi:MAG TPA: GDP-L-fucose synthase [Polyangiaceae bacterium]|jgi:GDP-L-fucose synthase|nr:GDP-L-fucose synthase [Polyangiaceae bacterium]
MNARYELSGKRLWIAGETGMVGSAISRALSAQGAVLIRPRQRIDMRRQTLVEQFVSEMKPDAIVIAAARVGGIWANSQQPADFIYDNLMIEANILEAAYRARTQKVLFLGSTCIYPREAPQPIREESLLTGPLEPTNQWYAIAKIAGVKLCQAYRAQHGVDFIAAMPTNLFGPGDNFDLESSHVLPALMRKIHEAKLAGERNVVVWGTGTPRREFMHVDDLARALIFLMENYSDAMPINVGTGIDCSIAELASLLARVIGYHGSFTFDKSKPDGTPRKVTDITRLRSLGFSPEQDLEGAVRRTYGWFLEHGLPPESVAAAPQSRWM